MAGRLDLDFMAPHSVDVQVATRSNSLTQENVDVNALWRQQESASSDVSQLSRLDGFFLCRLS